KNSQPAKPVGKPIPPPAAATVRLQCLRIFDQSNRGRELRIFECRSQSRHRLRVRDVNRQAKYFLGQMIDAANLAAAAGDRNSSAQKIEIIFAFEMALEQIERLADTHVNDRVEQLALDLLARKTGIIFQKNGFAGQAITE